MRLRTLLGIFSLLLPSLSLAVDQEETEQDQKVKQRAYPGGVDEQNLKVQTTLTKPVRKISPQMEEVPEAAATED